jgi:hypothetical protein
MALALAHPDGVHAALPGEHLLPGDIYHVKRVLWHSTRRAATVKCQNAS